MTSFAFNRKRKEEGNKKSFRGITGTMFLVGVSGRK
jgi:hypothetical protein